MDVGRALIGAGVGHGDHVGIVMANCPEFLEVLFGTLYVGAIAVPINNRFKARELQYVVENADLVALFTHDQPGAPTDHAGALAEALPGLDTSADPGHLSLDVAPLLRMVVALGTTADGFLTQDGLDELAAGVDDEQVEHRRQMVAVRDVGLMFYTSGTTAMPKGCALSHEANVRCSMETRRPVRVGRGRPDVGPAADVPHRLHPAAGRHLLRGRQPAHPAPLRPDRRPADDRGGGGRR